MRKVAVVRSLVLLLDTYIRTHPSPKVCNLTLRGHLDKLLVTTNNYESVG